MKDDRIKKITEEKGFFKHNNFEFVEVTENRAIIKANLTENSMNPYHIVHGGLTFGLGDMANGCTFKCKRKKRSNIKCKYYILKARQRKLYNCKSRNSKIWKANCLCKMQYL